ncbi:Sugar/inositol transporter [Neofusicoccum parvum]|uniref:Sugar/inositol transporter n=2 Tax=Neofusicoccum parvum TaxID=310453 RepID=A0ACB5S1J0_9PEZI|nr:putative mfs quinate protein [Neofusicoccum parvum UCRNP2]GME26573.1 Sugar/inositol transporter [Neofusicoccum parvum]GME65633.1 Sugar/inositol transporter [Neofusicoccum parvum]
MVAFLQRVVHNDAMKHDPTEIYGWRVYMLACSACFGGMLFGMDIGIIGGVLELPAFQEVYLGRAVGKAGVADLSANIVSTLQAGCFAACFFTSWLADKWGRRIALLIAALVAIVGCVMQAAGEGHLAVMYIGRFVAGLGVGAASMVVPLYISENAPRAIRGGLTGIYQLFIATGTMLAFWTNYGAIKHLHGHSTYIVPLVAQAIPAICLLVSMWLCNESPRFLAKQDRWEEATAVLTRIRQLPATHPYVQSELNEIAEQLEHERRLIGGASLKDLQKEMWLIPGNRKRALITVGLMVCQQMTGTNAINYYAPMIFRSLGIPSAETGLFATGIYGVVKMVTCACFLLFVADSLGRRRSLLWTSIAQGTCMYYIGIYVRVAPPVEGAAVPPAGYVALVCIFLFAGFFQFGWGPVCWIYISEIPTARLRSTNVALGAATQWLFNFVVARATPNMLTTMGKGGYGAFFTYGTFCFSMFMFVWFFIPETKGLSLERMDDLFGVTELVKDIEAHDRASTNRGSPQPGADEKTGVEQVEITPADNTPEVRKS